MLFGGMWFSRSKPPMNIFLRPLLDDINKLYTDGEFLHFFFINITKVSNLGVEVATPVGTKIVRAMLLQCSDDLPARACVTNMKQFNGKFGCLYCENPGKTLPGNFLHRFWPHDPSSSLRTYGSFRSDVVSAMSSRNSVSLHI